MMFTFHVADERKRSFKWLFWLWCVTACNEAIQIISCEQAGTPGSEWLKCWTPAALPKIKSNSFMWNQQCCANQTSCGRAWYSLARSILPGRQWNSPQQTSTLTRRKCESGMTGMITFSAHCSTVVHWILPPLLLVLLTLLARLWRLLPLFVVRLLFWPSCSSSAASSASSASSSSWAALWGGLSVCPFNESNVRQMNLDE